MKHLKLFENYSKYKFNFNDLVGLNHEHLNRKFKIVDRKCMKDKKSKTHINMYKIDTVDDNFDMDLWGIHMWEYESKIRNLTTEELEDLERTQTANKYNL